MAGIYIHIPFCKQACHYCDFHFSTNFRNVDSLVEAILGEMKLRKDFLNGESIQTIYFGGGTPSSIPIDYIGKLISESGSLFHVEPDAEITLEANPDDLTDENLSAWKNFGVNRLSVGVQSFYETHLKFMNRAHTGTQAIDGLKRAKAHGFDNITMDLIYGIPDMTMQQWERNVDQFLELDLPHLSAYGLTIEPQTHFGYLERVQNLKVQNDHTYNAQLDLLIQKLEQAGFDHYEISNFGKKGYHSRHNTSYWFGVKYLGLGPAAHSFDGEARQWNVNSNMKYIQGIRQGELIGEKEILSLTDRYNEYILTRLRTQWGVNGNEIKEKFGSSDFELFESHIKKYLNSGHVNQNGQTYFLSQKGKYMADKISSDLFLIV